ncbi:poly-beta-hydroxybutyrate polymerase [Sphingobium sp. SYK-6]|uniref:PHA/PHB synthase family protein n=1 Tax=Sphingobium sp. (strain NBRC 103272 / SYK-6) TaxID=627192 RepID=UPI0002276880|nr:class I poly(R)-hydroxyalkanoic acid synthase [Sphingobium sp. SYK-6]BAK65296.1 poly-beta-hydroxybutyrate polymerase [Sphingobium sp. SYK-6]
MEQQTIDAPGLAQMQHWTRVIGLAQQRILERSADLAERAMRFRSLEAHPNLEKIAEIQAQMANRSMALWEQFLARAGGSESGEGEAPSQADLDRRFADPRWRDNPVFDLIRQIYLLASEFLLQLAENVDGLDSREKEKLRFVTQRFVEASSPSNFPFTNPLVIERTIETRGENLLTGLEHLLADIDRGQLTHTDGSAFELGRNIATTPGKVVHETPLYQLIQYAPATPDVMATPLLIFPPWINRFYILDLNPQKSFVKWAVDQGLTVFMVSWKSADASMADVGLDDYVLRGQIDAIDVVRGLLGVPAVHAVGYCVAGTVLSATLALLAARGEADKVASATFFTTQVDFSQAGDLNLFVDDEQIALIESLVTEGFLDGRYLAATFNLLRGQDLIWNYVVNNYLLGNDYPQFDLLYWNGDTTNLPARWHRAYLTDFYRDNRLVQPGGLVVDGTPIDLSRVETPSYVQAGIEDHIAPACSVWKIMDHFTGPRRFVLAGSGHIAGVVNPPAAGKYQYWTSEEAQGDFDSFRAHAKETRGSWWPDWVAWLKGLDPTRVAASGARIPGEGALAAIEDAPGRYVRQR